MNQYDLLTLTGLLATLLCLLSWVWVRRRRATPAPGPEKLDTVEAWPPQAVRVLTLPERKACDVLRRAVPRNHLVLSQVPLSRFISVPTRHPYGEWLRRVGRLSADFLVCDASSRVVAVIEVRSVNESESSRKRHERIGEVLAAAGLPVHVWHDDDIPPVTEVRALLEGKARKAEHSEGFGEVSSTGRRMLPVPEIAMLDDDPKFLDTQADNPVPSGFFDDLEALAKSGRAARAS
jgi:hypothetical protein